MMCDKRPVCRCAWLTVGLILIIGGAIALVFLGIKVAKPFVETVGFTESRCRVTSVGDAGLLACDCGAGCQSVLPCRQVIVKYRGPEKTDVHNATLFADGRSWEQQSEEKCSVFTCHRDPRSNRAAVTAFVKENGRPAQEHPCYFNPDDKGEALLHRLGWLALGLYMGIPLLCFILGILMTVVSCRGC